MKHTYHASGAYHVVRIHKIVAGKDVTHGALVWHAVAHDPKLVVITTATVSDLIASRIAAPSLRHI